MLKRPMFQKLIAVLCCLFLLSGICAFPALADFNINNDELPWPTVYDNITWSYPKTVVSMEKNEKEFVLTARGEDGSENKLYLSFPAAGGFRLRGEKAGYFEPSETAAIGYTEATDQLTMKGTDVTVVFRPDDSPWSMEVLSREGQRVFYLTADQVAFGYQDGGMKMVKLVGDIADGEVLYGLGERFNSFSQVGESVLLWNMEAYNDLLNYNGDKTRGYKNIPILHSTNGYMLFFNSTYAAQADIGKTDKSKYTLDFNGDKFDFYMWTNTPLENVASYTTLTGRTIIPPKWALSYLAGNGGQVWAPPGNEGKYVDNVQEVMEKYAELGTPIQGLGGEGKPMEEAECYSILKKYGTRMLGWYWSAMGLSDMTSRTPSLISTPSKDMPIVWKKSSADKGSFIKNQDEMPGEYIDFTNPLAGTALSGKFRKLWDWGLSGCMVDMGDQVTLDSIFYNGMTGEEMHNFYAYWYNKVYYEIWEEAYQKGTIKDGYILFSRSASAGSQAFIGQFAGDHPSNFQGLRQAVLGGISAGTAGFSIWGSDIGGYGKDNNPPSTDCYIRWLQFGAFSPLMRAHGTSSRDPWMYGERAEEVYKDIYWLRENIVNTVYSGTIESHNNGTPMMQAMALAFPEQKELAAIDDQYMFCDDFLVAPVLKEEAYSREITFPEGTWVDLWTGKVVQGGQTLTVSAPQEQIPVYLKAGMATQIQVPPSLNLMETMKDVDRLDALLVTPGTQENTYWVDETTSVQYNTSTDADGNLTVKVDAGANVPVVYAYGIAASDVKVGGTSLKKSGSLPTEGAGYYVDPQQNRTVIRLPEGSWNELVISAGGDGPVNLAAGKTASASAESQKNVAANILDGEIDTLWIPGKGESHYVQVDLGESMSIDTVVLKWGSVYPASYKVQVSQDGSSWTDVYTEETCYGGNDTVKLDKTNARYVRMQSMSLSEENVHAAIQLAEMEVYGGAGSASSSSGLPRWALILIIAGGVVVVAAIAVTAAVVVNKKKSKAYTKIS